jgi:integrase
MTKPRLRLVAPATENRTVSPRRPRNGALRTREHLTTDEVERLIEAAKNNRYGHRDALMVLLAFRQGLRAGEVCDLRWEQVDFKTASLHVRRFKNGTPSTHPLTGRELRALRRHQRETGGHHSSSCRNGVRRCRHLGSRVWSSGRPARLVWASKPTRICSDTPAVTSWRMAARIRARFKPIWGTRTFRIRQGTRPSRRIGSKVSGEIKCDFVVGSLRSAAEVSSVSLMR